MQRIWTIAKKILFPGWKWALPLAALVLYQAAWCVLALIFPLIQQY